MPKAVFVGIDLGAESGRVVVGRLEGGRASVDLMGRVGLEPTTLGLKVRPECMQEAARDGDPLQTNGIYAAPYCS